MAKLTSLELSLIVTAALIVALGIVEIAVETHASSLFFTKNGGSTIGWPDDPPTTRGGQQIAPWAEHHYLDAVPAHFSEGPTEAKWVLGSLAIVLGAFSIVSAYIPHIENGEDHTGAKVKSTIIAAVFGGACVLGAIAILIAVFVLETQSSTWYYSGDESPGGHFTLECWTCQIAAQFRESTTEYRDLHPTCVLSQVTKWLIIPMLLTFVVMAAFLYKDYRRWRGVVRDTTIRSSEK